MKTNFGLKSLTKAVKDAQKGEISLLHFNTEMSIYDGINLKGGSLSHVNSQSSSSQK